MIQGPLATSVWLAPFCIEYQGCQPRYQNRFDQKDEKQREEEKFEMLSPYVIYAWSSQSPDSVALKCYVACLFPHLRWEQTKVDPLKPL